MPLRPLSELRDALCAVYATGHTTTEQKAFDGELQEAEGLSGVLQVALVDHAMRDLGGVDLSEFAYVDQDELQVDLIDWARDHDEVELPVGRSTLDAAIQVGFDVRHYVSRVRADLSFLEPDEEDLAEYADVPQDEEEDDEEGDDGEDEWVHMLPFRRDI